MLSIIICSVSPERLRKLSANIQETIGVKYEIIAINNQEKKWPIARAYNEGARQASYPYLFFVHEDVIFHSYNWGKIIENKLAEPDCGLIGFAGSKAMMNSYGGWGQYDWRWISYFYFFKGERAAVQLEANNVKLCDNYDPVAVLDGFAFFVRHEVWKEFPFDEELLTGFHCYDIDFSLSVGSKYRNYVCGFQIWVEHLSAGSFNSEWIVDSVRLYNAKWKNILPVKTDDICLTPKELYRNTEGIFYRFLFKALRTDVSRKVKWQILKDFWMLPFKWSHFTHCLSCTLKFIRC